jgi:hypothetical protein
MTILASLAIGLVLANAEGEMNQSCADEAIPLVAVFKDCVVSQAQHLEPSGEGADAVAVAAVGECGNSRDAFSKVVSSCLTLDEANSLLDQLDASARNAAVDTVVEIRANRNRTLRRST